MFTNRKCCNRKLFVFGGIAISLFLMLTFSACNVFSSSDYMSRKEYLSVHREFEADQGYSFDTHVTSRIDHFSSYQVDNGDLGEGIHVGYLYAIDSLNKTATLFIPEKVGDNYTYFQEWIICVIDGNKVIAVDGSGKKKVELFTTEESIKQISSDEYVFYYMTDTAICRYFPLEKESEVLVRGNNLDRFHVLSNFELFWIDPTEEYKEFVAAVEYPGMDSYVLMIELARAGLYGTGEFYLDSRDGILYESEASNPLGGTSSDPAWFEKYRK